MQSWSNWMNSLISSGCVLVEETGTGVSALSFPPTLLLPLLWRRLDPDSAFGIVVILAFKNPSRIPIHQIAS